MSSPEGNTPDGVDWTTLNFTAQDLSAYAQFLFLLGDEAEEVAANPIGWTIFSRGPDTFDIFPQLPLEIRTMIFVEAANLQGSVTFNIRKTLSICRESQRLAMGPLIESSEGVRSEYKRMWNYHYHSLTFMHDNPVMFVNKEALAAFNLAKPNTLRWMKKGNTIRFNTDTDDIRMDKQSLYAIHHWNVNSRYPGGWKKQFLGLDEVKNFYFSQSNLDFELDDALVDYINTVSLIEGDRPSEEKATETYEDELRDASSYELMRMHRTFRYMNTFFNKFVLYLQDKGVNVFIEDDNGVAQLQVRPVVTGATATPAT